MSRRHLLPFVATFALTALMTACGEDSPQGGGAGGAAAPTTASAPAGRNVVDATAFPVTLFTAGPGGSAVTITQRPERIVSLSPTATEVLFAINAGEQVVAVDSNSDFPPEAPTSELSGFQPSVEAVAAYEPDLVVMSFDPGEVAAGLAALDIPVIVHDAPPTVDGAYDQIEQLGAATGRVGDAAEVVSQIRAGVEAAAATIDAEANQLTYFYELDDTYFTVTSATFIGDLLAQVGLTSIADAAGPDSDYPQLSAEFIIDSDPDLILLADADCCGVTAEVVAARAGWGSLTAVQGGRVVPLDEDVASRWGPRMVELAERVADVAAKVTVGTG